MRTEDEDFKIVKPINATVGDVFNMLSTLDGLPAHWQEITEGENQTVKQIILNRGNGVKSTIKLNIQLPQLTQWTVLNDTADCHDWENTIVRFELEDMGDETCTLHFMHIGLTPELEQYPTYIAFWQQFITDMVNQSEPAHVNC